ncbi:MAG: DUF6088 family protein [Chloroflexi bacterium]|nr:DUF6088 family protein [Chloroflexota bacterium]
MKQKGYKQFITDHVCHLPSNIPIYTADIAFHLAAHFNLDIRQAKTLVNVNLPRIANTCDLVRYRKGIYYRAEDTVFGKTRLNPALVNRDRYISKNGEITGYETGASFLNQIGLTTQIPKYKEYATNVFKHRGKRIDKKLQVIIKKPKIQVTKENYRYLQLLDAIENKEKIGLDAPNPEMLFRKFIDDNALDLRLLIGYAESIYSKGTVHKIGRIYGQMLA